MDPKVKILMLKGEKRRPGWLNLGKYFRDFV